MPLGHVGLVELRLQPLIAAMAVSQMAQDGTPRAGGELGVVVDGEDNAVDKILRVHRHQRELRITALSR